MEEDEAQATWLPEEVVLEDDDARSAESEPSSEISPGSGEEGARAIAVKPRSPSVVRGRISSRGCDGETWP